MNAICDKKTAFVLLLGALVLAGNAGCSMPKASDFKPSNMFSLESGWPWRDEDAPAEGTPVRMVGAWTDTVLTKPGQNPQRGFGGRVMFYGATDEKPILVDGQLVVYAFSEAGREVTDNKPTRRYVFPPDQVALRMSTSDMGASYSFWLPWDEAGGAETEVSLICRFEPKGGAVVTSEQTRHRLPGAIGAGSVSSPAHPPKLPEGVPSRPARPTLESAKTACRTDIGAQLASYESPAEPQNLVTPAAVETTSTVPTRQMSVTSITLPKNFQLPAASALALPATDLSNQTTISTRQPPQLAPAQTSTAAPTTQAPPANTATSAIQMRPAITPVQILPPMLPQQIQQPMAPLQQSTQQNPAQSGVKTTISYPSPVQLLPRPAG